MIRLRAMMSETSGSSSLEYVLVLGLVATASTALLGSASAFILNIINTLIGKGTPYFPQ